MRAPALFPAPAPSDAPLQSSVPFTNVPDLSTVFTQGAAALSSPQSSGLKAIATSSIQDTINSKLSSNPKYLESPFSVGSLPDKTYALWINRQVTHALPVAIAWLANNDAHQPFAFTVTSSPLYTPPQRFPSNIPSRPLYFPPTILHLFITFFVAVTLATVPCLAVRAVVSDRVVQTKHVLAGALRRVLPLQYCASHARWQSWVFHRLCTGSPIGSWTPPA